MPVRLHVLPYAYGSQKVTRLQNSHTFCRKSLQPTLQSEQGSAKECPSISSPTSYFAEVPAVHLDLPTPGKFCPTLCSILTALALQAIKLQKCCSLDGRLWPSRRAPEQPFQAASRRCVPASESSHMHSNAAKGCTNPLHFPSTCVGLLIGHFGFLCSVPRIS